MRLKKNKKTKGFTETQAVKWRSIFNRVRVKRYLQVRVLRILFFEFGK